MNVRRDRQLPRYHEATPLPDERVECDICPAVTIGANIEADGWKQITLDNGWVLWMCKRCNTNPQLNPP